MPSPAAIATDRTTASVDRSLRTRPSTRRDRNGSTIAISPCPASSLTARPQASRVATVPGSSRSIRQSILPPSKPAAATESAS